MQVEEDGQKDNPYVYVKHEHMFRWAKVGWLSVQMIVCSNCV